MLSTLLDKARLKVADVLPDRPVRRTVQGTSLLVPASHALPYYTQGDSKYGWNLVEIAKGIGAREGRITLLDIGANIGDSTAQILDAVPGSAVCVEPDRAWWRYLVANVGHRDAIIEPRLLMPGSGAPATHGLAPVRSRGTTRFAQARSEESSPSLTVDELLARYSCLGEVRLVKSDTDGFDLALVPNLAATFVASRPVLFFECDHRLTRLAVPGSEPADVWVSLAEAGYTTTVVWGNDGVARGITTTELMVDFAAVLDRPLDERRDHYWDVAVAHRDDPVGTSVLTELCSVPLDMDSLGRGDSA